MVTAEGFVRITRPSYATRLPMTRATARPPLIIVALLGLIASSTSAADVPSHGRYDCVLASEGACSGRGADAICLGARVRRGPPTVFLKLDFDRDHAELNGIGGSIHRDREAGTASIHWDDLNLLESLDLVLDDEDGRTFAGLRNELSTASFRCRRDQRIGR
jgi:hypothetical protein